MKGFVVDWKANGEEGRISLDMRNDATREDAAIVAKEQLADLGYRNVGMKIFVGCDTCACFFCESNLCDFGCQQCDGRPSIFCSEESKGEITEAQS